jgi:hypothetical protein
MSTHHISDLQRAIPHRHLTCTVDYITPDAIYLSLSDDETDHTTRVGSYRVTSDSTA